MNQEKSIFSKIIDREIPAHFVYEDDVCVAILDAFPAVEGQTLIIPKVQTDYLFDLDNATYQHVLQVAARVARGLDTAFSTERTCLVVEGFEVPHVHVKLYPMTETTPLGNIIEHTHPLDQDTAADIAKRISTALVT